MVSCCRRRKLQQQVSEGAVIINVQVRTTAAKEADTTQLMETAVANGTFTKVRCCQCKWFAGSQLSTSLVMHNAICRVLGFQGDVDCLA